MPSLLPDLCSCCSRTLQRGKSALTNFKRSMEQVLAINANNAVSYW